jgi:hypothetical protein
MTAGQAFEAREIQEFAQMKLKGMLAAELGSQFRSGAGPRSQSAQRPQTMNLASQQ